jgi:hypothetical protein
VQLYAQRNGLKQLRGFQRVTMKAGETRTVEIPFTAAGATHIFVGSSSADERLKTGTN